MAWECCTHPPPEYNLKTTIARSRNAAARTQASSPLHACNSRGGHTLYTAPWCFVSAYGYRTRSTPRSNMPTNNPHRHHMKHPQHHRHLQLFRKRVRHSRHRQRDQHNRPEPHVIPTRRHRDRLRAEMCDQVIRAQIGGTLPWLPVCTPLNSSQLPLA